MPKGTALCMIAFLLFLTVSHAVGRPVAAFHDTTPMQTHHDHVGNEVGEVYAEENCEGLAEDECMMRRTLQAHLDYIYTQQKQP